MGGADAVDTGFAVSDVGSSPRGRGGLVGIVQPALNLGLIPAWAGRTPCRDDMGENPRAHPRVGGADTSGLASTEDGVGSSPRGRGGLPPLAINTVTVGLIPAWAGRTCWWSGRGPTTGAHPRVGGADAIDEFERMRAEGSSPRGRGGPDDVTLG